MGTTKYKLIAVLVGSVAIVSATTDFLVERGLVCNDINVHIGSYLMLLDQLSLAKVNHVSIYVQAQNAGLVYAAHMINNTPVPKEVKNIHI